MNEKEIEAMKAKIATLEAENAELKESNTLLGKDIAERDNTIADLKKNAQERGQQFKKLKEMTEAEKELLSEKEKELLARQEALEEERENDRRERAERDQKEKEARINSIARRFAKGNEEIAEQIKLNLGKLSPELVGKAITEEEITPLVQDAFNMIGISNSPDALNLAHNTGGLPAKGVGEKDYADTQEGKQLGQALGLQSFTSENNQ